MIRILKWTGAIVAVLLLIVAIGLMTWEPFFATKGTPPEGNRTYTAEIIRDDFGVPHIYGKTDADVAYGVAIAHSEDDFTTLQDVVAMSRGRYGATRAARRSGNGTRCPQTRARCSMPTPSA